MRNFPSSRASLINSPAAVRWGGEPHLKAPCNASVCIPSIYTAHAPLRRGTIPQSSGSHDLSMVTQSVSSTSRGVSPIALPARIRSSMASSCFSISVLQ